MKDYELTVVFHPDLEMNPDPALEKVKNVILSSGGKITKEETDGKKRLAYTIKGQEYGLYYYLDVQLPADAPSKINNTLNISDEIIRLMLVRSDGMRAKIEAHRQAEEEKGENKSENNQEKGE